MLLVAPTQRHRGAPLIPLLCHFRSADVLSFHLENCDKGNTPEVCKEEKDNNFFFLAVQTSPHGACGAFKAHETESSLSKSS